MSAEIFPQFKITETEYINYVKIALDRIKQDSVFGDKDHVISFLKL